jgi:hypothetical protein
MKPIPIVKMGVIREEVASLVTLVGHSDDGPPASFFFDEVKSKASRKTLLEREAVVERGAARRRPIKPSPSGFGLGEVVRSHLGQ